MKNPMMTRLLTLSCILLALATFAVMSDQSNVIVSSSTPQISNPGDEFMVRISIEKGTLKKGAVLQQILPAGFTASAIENEGSQFYFENQMVRFVWDNMPDKTVLVVAYLIKTDVALAEGFKKIDGTFICAQDNSTSQTSLPTNTIYITNDFPVSTAKEFAGNSGNIHLLRSIEEKKGELSKGYRITIDVDNENEVGSASWIDQIPAGYSVEINAANNASFHQHGTLLKFHWKEMPAEKIWSFSYTIFPSKESGLEENPSLQGIMVYGSDESIKTFMPAGSVIPKTSGAALVASVPTGAALANPPEENTSETGTEMTEQTETQNQVTGSSAKEEVSASAGPANSMMPNVQRGIYYRVQIAATKRSPTRDSEFFEKRFNISRPVDMVEQDGWKKYCIGTFSRLEPAKSFERETREHITDAFVVAYRDGQRIPVAEAMETLSLSLNQ